MAWSAAAAFKSYPKFSIYHAPTKPELVCEIVLDKQIHPDEIRGKLVAKCEYNVEYYGLVVELHATITYGEKEDSKIVEELLGIENEEEHRLMTKSKIWQQLAGDAQALQKSGLDPFQCRKLLRPGKHEFPFFLKLPMDCEATSLLPASFSSSLGTLMYTIKVYKRSCHGYTEVIQKAFKHFGTHQLSSHAPTFEPISFKISSSPISIECDSDPNEYLLGDKVPFQIVIDGVEDPGHKAIQSLKNVSIELLKFQTVNLGIRNSPKKEKQEVMESFSKKLQGQKTSTIDVEFSSKKGWPPTFFRNSSAYSVEYVLRCKVQSATGDIYCKDFKVIFGTSRKSSSPTEEPESSNFIRVPSIRIRSYSISSCSSSAQTESEKGIIPPTYSQLSSRATSVMSFETLPPHYEDL